MTIPNSADSSTVETGAWEVHTPYVGQADAHSLVTPQNTRVLVDADEERIVDFLNKTNYNTINIYL